MKKLYASSICFLICVAAFAQPVITSFSPASGPVGTAVTISGSNFSSVPANNIVFFGAVQAVVNTASTGSLHVTVPAGASFQPITVLTGGLITSSASPFVITFTCGGGVTANSFFADVDFTAGSDPYSVSIGDIDGDGKPDLALPNFGSSTFSVLRNTSTSGSVSFAPKLDSATGGHASSLSIGDVDEDGKLDIVIVNYVYNTISVFKNTSTAGSISFAAKQSFPTGNSPSGAVIADIDGDGKPDIAVVNYSDNTISVLRNTGSSGVVSFAVNTDFAVGNLPNSITAGDFDGDGKLDIAVTNSGAATISILKNTSSIGSVSFAAKVDYTSGTSPDGIAAGDIDGDGKPEIAVTNNTSNTISIFRNTGSAGTISFAAKADFVAGAGTHGLSISDLDGDGMLDIAAANHTDNSISIFKNISTIGTISFNAKVDFTTGAGSFPQNPAIGDLDGDGRSDITAANNNGTGSAATLRSVLYTAPVMTSAGASSICSGTNVNIPLTSTMSANYSWIAVSNANTTGESTTAQTVSAINNTLINNFTSIQTVVYTVTPSSIVGGCVGTSQTVAVTVVSSPFMTNTSSAVICNGDSLHIGLTSSIPSSYTWIASDNLNTTGESTTNKTTSLINDFITNTSLTAQTVNYTVTPTSITAGCAGSPQTVAVSVHPLPVVGFSGLSTAYCRNAAAQTLTGSPAGGTFSGNGISGNSFSPAAVVSTLDTIIYTYVNGSDGCANTISHTTSLLPLPAAPEICMVMVDSASNYNVVYWDKASYTNADSFIVYREITSNVYKRAGAVSNSATALFADTARFLYYPNTGNPNTSAYRYKLQVRDTCGNYSALGSYHRTINVNQVGTSFIFNDYIIEGQAVPIPQLTSYLLVRDDNGTGNPHTVITGTSSPLVDAAYASYPNGKWLIETSWTINCTPAHPFAPSRSNIVMRDVTGIALTDGVSPVFSVYPNPYTGSTAITYSLTGRSDVNIEVYNTIGQKTVTLVNAEQSAGEYKYRFSAAENGLDAGVYFVKITMNGKALMKRIVELR